MTITAGPFSQADGAQTISIGAESYLPWHEIAVSFEDNTGAPLPSVASGSLAGAALGQGADQTEAFTETLNLPNGDRRWKPFFSLISSITLTPTGLPVNARYRVTIINSRG